MHGTLIQNEAKQDYEAIKRLTTSIDVKSKISKKSTVEIEEERAKEEFELKA